MPQPTAKALLDELCASARRELAGAWLGLWAGARRGTREALVGVWTPLRPRAWRYVIAETRRAGLRAGLLAFFIGATDLILAGRLGPDGRVRDA